MISTSSYISIVIPTHNRCSSLKRLLDRLARQTYPCIQMEVIVVADDCIDGTINMLRQYQAPFAFQFIEVPGLGPAVARNRGAEIATGKLLLFLDDDVDPSDQLVEAHVRAHVHKKIVVIGYLPFSVPGKACYFKQSLRSWWEQKFYRMRNPAYRYSHEDLLTGNVSLSVKLFHEVQGFNEKLRCREDYEIGIRLMKANAEFLFSNEAWGLHRDEVTDLRRSLKRKREEGKADVKCWRLHPDVNTTLQDAYARRSSLLLRSQFLSFIVRWPRLTDASANLIAYLAAFAERLRLRRHWLQLNSILHHYWYLRGLLDELKTHKRLKEYLQHDPSKHMHQEEIAVNLKDGIANAEQLLDRVRPSGITIFYDESLLGHIRCKSNYERLQGRHLRHLLATQIAYPLMKAHAFQKLSGKSIEDEKAPVEPNLSF